VYVWAFREEEGCGGPDVRHTSIEARALSHAQPQPLTLLCSCPTLTLPPAFPLSLSDTRTLFVCMPVWAYTAGDDACELHMVWPRGHIVLHRIDDFAHCHRHGLLAPAQIGLPGRLLRGGGGGGAPTVSVSAHKRAWAYVCVCVATPWWLGLIGLVTLVCVPPQACMHAPPRLSVCMCAGRRATRTFCPSGAFSRKGRRKNERTMLSSVPVGVPNGTAMFKYTATSASLSRRSRDSCYTARMH
jgi:hypothetical protein